MALAITYARAGAAAYKAPAPQVATTSRMNVQTTLTNQTRTPAPPPPQMPMTVQQQNTRTPTPVYAPKQAPVFTPPAVASQSTQWQAPAQSQCPACPTCPTCPVCMQDTAPPPSSTVGMWMALAGFALGVVGTAAALKRGG